MDQVAAFDRDESPVSGMTGSQGASPPVMITVLPHTPRYQSVLAFMSRSVT